MRGKCTCHCAYTLYIWLLVYFLTRHTSRSLSWWFAILAILTILTLFSFDILFISFMIINILMMSIIIFINSLTVPLRYFSYTFFDSFFDHFFLVILSSIQAEFSIMEIYRNRYIIFVYIRTIGILIRLIFVTKLFFNWFINNKGETRPE